MDSKPSDSRAADAAALARDLVDRLAAISASLAHGPDRPAGAGTAPGGGPGGASPVDFSSPRAVLENGAGYVAPFLPAGASLRPLKALLLRLLRVITRDQTVFNSAILESLRGTLRAADAAFRETATAIERARSEAATAISRSEDAEKRVREVLEKSGPFLEDVLRAAVDETRTSLEADRRSRGEIASRLDVASKELESALDRLRGLGEGLAETRRDLADARTASDQRANDLLATQVRVDGLEKDRDRLSDVSAAGARTAEGLQDSLAALEAQLSERSEALRLLKLEWSTLRSELSAFSERPAKRDSARPDPAAPKADDPLRAGIYVDFEEGFRGSETEIRKRQESDAAFFLKAPGPVADLGCGRGEFLEALEAAGIPAIGCDANPVMAARAKSKGLKVDKADLFEWLTARPNGSLGGITAYQVVEHLPPARLYELVELSAAKLAPGGILLFETVNPESAYAMKWFWMDLTHVRPVPAPSLSRLLSASGFRDLRIDWRSPVPESEAPPAELREDKSLGPMMKLLFGPQDYAVIGRK